MSHQIDPLVRRLSFTVSLVAALVNISGNTLQAQTRPQNTVVVADFSTPRPVKSASGLLIGADSSNPGDDVIAPIKPQFWRIINMPGTYERSTRFASTIHLVLSDYFCYPASNWCGKNPPYEDWQAFESGVRKVAESMRGKNVMYDVWNEPDYPYFWSGTREQFFETYLRAYRVLRQTLGSSALIGGPSLAKGYDKEYITAFLNYCRANGCEVNFLSWHELNDQDMGIASIGSHIKDARASFVYNAAYKDLKISRIDINEIVGPYYAHVPGAMIGYLDQIEQGGADSAAKTCWPDSAGASECFNNTLDGLLTADTHKPRAGWWAYKAYAEGVPTRVAAHSSDIRVVPLASGPAANGTSAQLLVGYFNAATVLTTLTEPINFQLALLGLDRLPFLSNAPQVHVKVEKIPNSGEAALPAPILLGEFNIARSGSTLMTYLTDLKAGEVYQLTLSKPR